MSQDMYRPGLEGVIAGKCGIACVDQDDLLYRGYAIDDLAKHTTFEEVVYLLLYGELPNRADLERLKATLFALNPLPDAVVQALRLIPNDVPTMDVLRTMVSMTGHFDPVPARNDLASTDPEALRRQALRLIAQAGGILSARHRLQNGQEPLPAKPGLSHAAQILYQAQGVVPDELSARLLDLTLVLYAEHEFNASTFTARVICSTQSDMVSSVVGAIGALKGPLHGGANEEVVKMLTRFKTADEARAWLREALARKEKVMGFGHRVYKYGDHRAVILEGELRKLAEAKGAMNWMAIYDAIREIMENEKKIHANLDYPCGLTYYLLRLPLDLYTPLFVAARMAGWCAHYIEQRAENRIYRPLSFYIGPPRRKVPSIHERA